MGRKKTNTYTHYINQIMGFIGIFEPSGALWTWACERVDCAWPTKKKTLTNSKLGFTPFGS